MQAGGMEVVQPLAVGVDGVGGDRCLDVLGVIAGGRGVRQVPGVKLDDDRPAEGELLGDLGRHEEARGESKKGTQLNPALARAQSSEEGLFGTAEEMTGLAPARPGS